MTEWRYAPVGLGREPADSFARVGGFTAARFASQQVLVAIVIDYAVKTESDRVNGRRPWSLPVTWEPGAEIQPHESPAQDQALWSAKTPFELDPALIMLHHVVEYHTRGSVNSAPGLIPWCSQPH
jgi:hypothetical protein